MVPQRNNNALKSVSSAYNDTADLPILSPEASLGDWQSSAALIAPGVKAVCYPQFLDTTRNSMESTSISFSKTVAASAALDSGWRAKCIGFEAQFLESSPKKA